ncbi:hypothetical protein OPKNFCMD_3826 [Methylobacterium crusticola]|uniref:Glycine-rich domain-containing protein n=1 Tax=Methylobacterium crusticola TaxID=1697972 RepID=A0ABQ4R071_9HYPH|nr:hypothetical protein [Methylobacterium crusticola]GJD51075.1 hypothetical protein OPKNFCMD_3826 [Methylobacterium crusticola]
MLYNPPSGSIDPNAPYIGKNTTAGTQGSKVPRGAVEFPQREIVNVILASGQDPSNADLQQLLKAIRWLIQNAYNDPTVQAAVINLITNNYARGSYIGRQIFANPGTVAYTPTPGTKSVRVTVHGGGAGGGGADPTSSGQFSAGGGGGAGGIAISRITSGFAGALVTVGAAGAGGVNPIGIAPFTRDGGNGGDSSFGAFLSATGGGGARGGAAGTFVNVQAGGGGGVGIGGSELNLPGAPGMYSTACDPGNAASGFGGISILYGRGGNPIYSGGGAGEASQAYGAGGSGASNGASAPARQGGAGRGGIVLVDEFA